MHIKAKYIVGVGCLALVAGAGFSQEKKNDLADPQVREANAFKEKPVDPEWLKEKARLQKIGEAHATAWDLYQYFKSQAHEGAPRVLPSWSGPWKNAATPFHYDPDERGYYSGTTAQLKPGPKAAYLTKLAAARKGEEFDPLGACAPAGMPRWFSEPYAHEWIITPHETYLVNELANEMRRVYTDGQGHPDPDSAFPTYDGDSIGFWDGDKLYIHTQDLMAGPTQRAEPDHTDGVQTVEIWHRVNPKLINVDVWIYDPEVLEVPWFIRHTYVPMEQSLRIHYYDCVGAANTQVTKLPDGSTTFKDLTFGNPHNPKAAEKPAKDTK